MFIFVDGGNKRWEFEQVAPLVLSGDLVVVDDVPLEFDPQGEREATAASKGGLLLMEYPPPEDGTRYAVYAKVQQEEG